MANIDSKDKLADYLEGFLALEVRGISPIGAILVDEAEREEVADNLSKRGFVISEDSASRNGLVAINIKKEISPALKNSLLGYSHGQGPEKVMLIINKNLFGDHNYFERIASSVCRL